MSVLLTINWRTRWQKHPRCDARCLLSRCGWYMVMQVADKRKFIGYVCRNKKKFHWQPVLPNTKANAKTLGYDRKTKRAAQRDCEKHARANFAKQMELF